MLHLSLPIQLIDLFNFIIIILVVLVSFGVSRQAIKYPNESWTWRSVKEIFLEPYFMVRILTGLPASVSFPFEDLRRSLRWLDRSSMPGK